MISQTKIFGDQNRLGPKATNNNGLEWWIKWAGAFGVFRAVRLAGKESSLD
jgi:hypothetical protein